MPERKYLSKEDIARLAAEAPEGYSSSSVEDAAKVIKAFSEALRVAEFQYGTEEQEETHVAAFDAARAAGWDAQYDHDFMMWASKAHNDEILVHGLHAALEHIWGPGREMSEEGF